MTKYAIIKSWFVRVEPLVVWVATLLILECFLNWRNPKKEIMDINIVFKHGSSKFLLSNFEKILYSGRGFSAWYVTIDPFDATEVFYKVAVVWMYGIIMSGIKAEWICTLYSSLNVKELLAWNRRNIWSLSSSNRIRSLNHLAHKRTPNHLAKLAKCLSCVVTTYLYDAFDCMLFDCMYVMSCTGFRVNLQSSL